MKVSPSQKRFTLIFYKYNDNKCEYQSTDLNNINSHVTSCHHSEKFIFDDICDEASFPDKSNLNQHLKEHHKRYLINNNAKIDENGRRMYFCSVENCNYQVLTERCFSEHKNIHSLAFEHKCDVCVASFEVKPELKRHVTMHHNEVGKTLISGNTVYHCMKGCEYSTTKVESLRNHYFFHGVNKNMSCPYCDVSYTYANQIGNHIKSCHPALEVPSWTGVGIFLDKK